MNFQVFLTERTFTNREHILNLAEFFRKEILGSLKTFYNTIPYPIAFPDQGKIPLLFIHRVRLIEWLKVCSESGNDIALRILRVVQANPSKIGKGLYIILNREEEASGHYWSMEATEGNGIAILLKMFKDTKVSRQTYSDYFTKKTSSEYTYYKTFVHEITHFVQDMLTTGYASYSEKYARSRKSGEKKQERVAKQDEYDKNELYYLNDFEADSLLSEIHPILDEYIANIIKANRLPSKLDFISYRLFLQAIQPAFKPFAILSRIVKIILDPQSPTVKKDKTIYSRLIARVDRELKYYYTRYQRS